MPRTGKRKQRPWEADEPTSSRLAIVRKDPFRYLCWDCASIVMSYLDVCDLARCERVDKGWRRFVHEWMGAAGFYQHFPNLPESTVNTLESTEARAAVFKACAVDEALRQKWTTGRASCAREYIFPGSIFTVKGDFVIWNTHDQVYWQRLGFRSDGTLHPVTTFKYTPEGRINRMVVNEAGYMFLTTSYPVNPLSSSSSPQETSYLAPFGRLAQEIHTESVVFLETGEELWKQAQDPDYELVAIGRDRLYFHSCGTQEGSFVARDLRSGEMLYKTYHGHTEMAHVPAIIVRKQDGDELIVKQWRINEPLPVVGSIFTGLLAYEHDVGVRVFDGQTGQCLQTILCERTFPVASPNDGEVALLGGCATKVNYYRIHKYRFSAEQAKFHLVTTEVLDQSPAVVPGNHDSIPVRSVDPYAYRAGRWDGDRGTAYLLPIVARPAPSDWRPSEVWDGDERPVDAWLTLGPGQEITVAPRTEAELETRRSLRVDDPWRGPFTWWITEFDHRNRLVCHAKNLRRAYVFDFGFRAPQALGTGSDGKNETTMEI